MKPSLKITCIYLLVGSIWIIVSDYLILALFNDDITKLSHYQSLKGIFYVLSTSLLLFFLVRFYYCQVTRKIDELEILNKKLKVQTTKLELTNKNLEQFAYSASHDLQEPLRMVTSFLSLLDKKYANKLDDKAREYIYFAVDGAKRMRDIILDILEFSRVGKHVEGVADIPLKDVLDEVSRLQSELISEKGGLVHYADEAIIRTSRTPLVQIFQNLIGNALKYHRPGVPPEIWITADQRGEEWLIGVRDNGQGIAAEYLEAIFGIFKRLHTNAEVKGTGMGLAIVQRSVESLGGKIGLSQP